MVGGSCEYMKTRLMYEEFEPIDYLTHGEHCIDVAKSLELPGQNRSETSYPIRILLVHGIELLLKSFIQQYNPREFRQIMSLFDTRHDIKKLYETAEKIACSQHLSIFVQPNLKNAVDNFVSNFYPDTVRARYKNRDISVLNYSIFKTLRTHLITPLEKLIPPRVDNDI